MQEIILKLSLLGAAFSSSVIFLTFFTPFYNFRFKSYDVYNSFDAKWSREEINNEFTNIQKYLLPFDGSELNRDFFSREDILHMKDVRTLYTLIYLLFAINLSVFIGSSYLAVKNNKTLKIDKFEIGVLALLVILSLITLTSFSSLFEAFHKIIFPNNYWLLDPRYSNLIKYFPESLFAELTLLLVIFTIVFYIAAFKVTTTQLSEVIKFSLTQSI